MGSRSTTRIQQAQRDPIKSNNHDLLQPNRRNKLIVDAGPHGLRAILTQKQINGLYRPISYGSKALSDIETRYSQTEKEALAVLWACQHFQHVNTFITTSSTVTLRLKSTIHHLRKYRLQTLTLHYASPDGCYASKHTTTQSRTNQDTKMQLTSYREAH